MARLLVQLKLRLLHNALRSSAAAKAGSSPAPSAPGWSRLAPSPSCLTTSGAPAGIRMPLLVLGAAGYGLALVWAGVHIAAATGAQKLPELNQIAIRSKL